MTQTIAGGCTVSYLYDQAGNRTRLTWPDGFYVTYSYDALGRMDLVKENGSGVLADYSYDDLSRRTRLVRGGQHRHALQLWIIGQPVQGRSDWMTEDTIYGRYNG